MSKPVFVSPIGKNWKVQTVGAGKAAGIFEMKSEAVEKAISIAKNNKAELRVQNRDGKIGWCNSYGNDPRKIKG
ncbi:MAG: DUF2188 domain-containing protein [Candidatus Falkowbacteria bacterium]